MDKKPNHLEEPGASYGRKVHIEEISFEPMENMMETLRAQGCVTHEELVNHLSKHLQ